jgi:hypothetical protein
MDLFRKIQRIPEGRATVEEAEEGLRALFG